MKRVIIGMRSLLLLGLFAVPGLADAADLLAEVKCTIPEPKKAIDDVRVVARLYEYDSRLADVGADEVDVITMNGLDLRPGKDVELQFPLGAPRREDRSYYVTIFVHPDEKSQKRLYFINGFQKVFEKGDAEGVKVRLRAVER